MSNRNRYAALRKMRAKWHAHLASFNANLGERRDPFNDPCQPAYERGWFLGLSAALNELDMALGTPPRQRLFADLKPAKPTRSAVPRTATRSQRNAARP